MLSFKGFPSDPIGFAGGEYRCLATPSQFRSEIMGSTQNSGNSSDLKIDFLSLNW